MSDTESPTTAPTPPFPLLKLPSEIRTRIWTLVVEVEIVVIDYGDYRSRQTGRHFFPTTMSLASTCRQMYHEVAPIYYSKNLFHFPHESRLRLSQFAEAIGPTNTESITRVGFPRHLHMPSHMPPMPPGLSLFPNLKTVAWLDLHNTYGPFCNKPFPQIIQGLFCEWPSSRHLKAAWVWNDVVESHLIRR